MIGIIDYGLGNIKAFEHIYQRLQIPVTVIREPAQFSDGITRFILPGVGSFDWAMRLLNESALRPALEEKVIGGTCLLLGVCVGMQLLFERSEEGSNPGLGWIKGEVCKLTTRENKAGLRLPHMGWNTISPMPEEPLFFDLGSNPDFYFLHSYVAIPLETGTVIAESEYNGGFASAVRAGNIVGTQFHPEKSHGNGIKVLEKFAREAF